jgi:hypothetical protein
MRAIDLPTILSLTAYTPLYLEGGWPLLLRSPAELDIGRKSKRGEWSCRNFMSCSAGSAHHHPGKMKGKSQGGL